MEGAADANRSQTAIDHRRALLQGIALGDGPKRHLPMASPIDRRKQHKLSESKVDKSSLVATLEPTSIS